MLLTPLLLLCAGHLAGQGTARRLLLLINCHGSLACTCFLGWARAVGSRPLWWHRLPGLARFLYLHCFGLCCLSTLAGRLQLLQRIALQLTAGCRAARCFLALTLTCPLSIGPLAGSRRGEPTQLHNEAAAGCCARPGGTRACYWAAKLRRGSSRQLFRANLCW